MKLSIKIVGVVLCMIFGLQAQSGVKYCRPDLVLGDHTEKINEVVSNSDGKKILTASSDKTVRLWNLANESISIESCLTLKGHTGEVLWAVLSPDESMILTASEDKTAKLWDLKGKLITTFSGHTGEVLRAIFSPDGKNILTSSLDDTARLWNLHGVGKILKGDSDNAAMFTSDGSKILTAGDCCVRIWDSQGNKLGNEIKLEDEVFLATFRPGGTMILTGEHAGPAKLWKVNGTLITSFQQEEEEESSDACFSSDGKTVLTVNYNNENGSKAKLWDLKGTCIQVFGGDYPVEWADFSPDGYSILTRPSISCRPPGESPGGPIQLWEIGGDGCTEFGDSSSEIESTIFNGDGSIIITIERSGAVKLWNLDGELRAVLLENIARFSKLKILPNKKELLTISSDNKLVLWDMSQFSS